MSLIRRFYPASAAAAHGLTQFGATFAIELNRAEDISTPRLTAVR